MQARKVAFSKAEEYSIHDEPREKLVHGSENDSLVWEKHAFIVLLGSDSSSMRPPNANRSSKTQTHFEHFYQTLKNIFCPRRLQLQFRPTMDRELRQSRR